MNRQHRNDHCGSDNSSAIVHIERGLVTHVHAPAGIEVIVRDYDTDGIEPKQLHHDVDGRSYTQTIWPTESNGADALTLPCAVATMSALEDGFIILTHNPNSDPSDQFEAWAYQGPLNFEKAHPIRFGIGANFTEALGALEDQLSQLSTASHSG